MSELKRLLDAYASEFGSTPNILGVALSSRKNLCIHPMVRGGGGLRVTVWALHCCR